MDRIRGSARSLVVRVRAAEAGRDASGGGNGDQRAFFRYHSRPRASGPAWVEWVSARAIQSETPAPGARRAWPAARTGGTDRRVAAPVQRHGDRAADRMRQRLEPRARARRLPVRGDHDATVA